MSRAWSIGKTDRCKSIILIFYINKTSFEPLNIADEHISLLYIAMI